MTSRDIGSFKSSKSFGSSSPKKSKIFKRIPYINKEHYLCACEIELLRDQIVLLSQREKSKLAIAHPEFTIFLNESEFLELIRHLLSKIKNLPTRISQFSAVVRLEGEARAQQVVKKHLRQGDILLATFFAELPPDQKLLAFKKLSTTHWKKIFNTLELFTTGMIDNHTDINPGNIAYLMFLPSDEFKRMQSASLNDINEMEYLKKYSTLLHYKKCRAKIAVLLHIHNTASLDDRTCIQIILDLAIQHMNDGAIKALLKKYPELQFFIPEQRVFYLNKGDLNTRFDLLLEKARQGAVPPTTSSLNKMRLLAQLAPTG